MPVPSCSGSVGIAAHGHLARPLAYIIGPSTSAMIILVRSRFHPQPRRSIIDTLRGTWPIPRRSLATTPDTQTATRTWTDCRRPRHGHPRRRNEILPAAAGCSRHVDQTPPFPPARPRRGQPTKSGSPPRTPPVDSANNCGGCAHPGAVALHLTPGRRGSTGGASVRIGHLFLLLFPQMH